MFYGVIAALGYGTADVVATMAARRSGVIRTLLAVQLVGLLAMTGVIAWRAAAPSGSPQAWLLAVGLATINFAGMLLLYRAFSVGTLSLVSPIASGFAVVTAALALLAGERPPGAALLGTALLVAGVAVVSQSQPTGGMTLAGVPEAIGAAIGLGASYWALGEVTPEMGVLWPVLVTRATQLVLSLGLLWMRRERPALLVPGLLPMYAAAGMLDTAALLAFNLGVDSSYTTTTTAITSLYSVVTVFLAWLIFRDRLTPSQWSGVAVVLAGALLVSV